MSNRAHKPIFYNIPPHQNSNMPSCLLRIIGTLKILCSPVAENIFNSCDVESIFHDSLHRFSLGIGVCSLLSSFPMIFANTTQDDP